MQKPDIIGAFKLASQRNENLDAVKRSLIAAGYDVQDVEDSALAFSQGQIKPVVKQLPSQTPGQPAAQPAKSLLKRFFPAKPSTPMQTPTQTKPSEPPAMQAAQPVQEQQEQKSMPKYLVIAIISSAVIVVGLLGYVIYKIIVG